MELEGFTPIIRWSMKTDGVMPKVKIVDAANGVVQIYDYKKCQPGIYQLALEAPDHAPIILKVEVQ